MHHLGAIFLWLFALIWTAVGLATVLARRGGTIVVEGSRLIDGKIVETREERAETLRDYIGFKVFGLGAVLFGAAMIYSLLGFSAPELSQTTGRLLATAALVVAVVACCVGAWLCLAKRAVIRAWGRAASAEVDVVQDAMDDGPADAISAYFWNRLAAWRYGWLLLASLCVGLGASFAIWIVDVWTGQERVEQGWARVGHFFELFDTVTLYVVFGVVLIAGLAMLGAGLIRHEREVRTNGLVAMAIGGAVIGLSLAWSALF